MSGLMRKHQEKTWAEQAKQAKKEKEQQPEDASQSTALDVEVTNNSDDETWLSALKQDISRLKAMPDHDDRDALKRDALLEKYQPYVDKWLDSDVQGENEIIANYAIWELDGGDVKKAVELAERAQKRGVAFNMLKDSKEPILFFSDQVYRQANDAFKESPDDDLPNHFGLAMQRIEDDKWNLGDTRTSFFYKLQGLKQLHDGNKKETLKSLITANSLNDKIGVKTRIKELKAELTE